MCDRSMQTCSSACRVLLTDLGSLNGTWVNRASLRPRADSQIRAQDIIAFGSSDATFQLIAIDAASSQLPLPLESAEAVLRAAWGTSMHELPKLESSEQSDSNGGLLLRRIELVAQYRESPSRADRCKYLLQVQSSPPIDWT